MIIESRSILMPNNMAFTPHNLVQMFNDYKNKYKADNNETFKGNCYLAITVGVIEDKQLPDIDDCLLLIRGGNNWCSLENAELIYNSFIKAYPDRGTLGCFCDMCRILCQDQPFAKQVTDMIETLEEKVVQYFKSRQKIEELKNKLMNHLNKIENVGDIGKTAEKVENIVKEVGNELGVTSESTENNEVETSAENK